VCSLLIYVLLKSLIDELEEIAPPELAEDWDRGAGLVLRGSKKVEKACITLDITPFSVKEAVKRDAGILIAHHPLLFNPITTIDNHIREILETAIPAGLSIYVMHTNYDKVDGGINDTLAQILQIKGKKLEGNPYIRVGLLEASGAKELATHVSKKLNTHVTWVNDRAIQTVACMGGSGLKEENIRLLIDSGVDAFISGELRHECLKFDNIVIIDATHQATETPGMKKLVDILPVESFYLEHKYRTGFVFP